MKILFTLYVFLGAFTSNTTTNLYALCFSLDAFTYCLRQFIVHPQKITKCIQNISEVSLETNPDNLSWHLGIYDSDWVTNTPNSSWITKTHDSSLVTDCTVAYRNNQPLAWMLHYITRARQALPTVQWPGSLVATNHTKGQSSPKQANIYLQDIENYHSFYIDTFTKVAVRPPSYEGVSHLAFKLNVVILQNEYREVKSLSMDFELLQLDGSIVTITCVKPYTSHFKRDISGKWNVLLEFTIGGMDNTVFIRYPFWVKDHSQSLY